MGNIRWVMHLNPMDLQPFSIGDATVFFLDATRPPDAPTPNAPSVDGPGRQVEMLRVGMDSVEILPGKDAPTVCHVKYCLDGTLEVGLGKDMWRNVEDLRPLLLKAGWKPLQ